MAAKPAPILVRLLRLAQLVVHLVRGLFTVSLIYPHRSVAARLGYMRRWSGQLLALLAISTRHVNKPATLASRCMLVMNHISWLDIFVVASQFPANFVAKAEIRGWPVVGRLCTGAGTLYIERGKRGAAKRAKNEIAENLHSGTPIAIFPEGATTYGRELGRFHAALFQPSIDADAVLQPVALRYLDAAGRHTNAAGYVGDMSLLESVWRIVSTRHIVAEIEFLAPTYASGQTRRELADRTEAVIAAALGLTQRHSQPGTDAYPPDE